MATLECPRCQAGVPTSGSWAETAVATLGGAPAVPAMATQLRCPHCGLLFSEPEASFADAPRARTLWVALALLVLALLACWGWA